MLSVSENIVRSRLLQRRRLAREPLGYLTLKSRARRRGRKAKNAEYEVVVVDTRPEEPPEPPAGDGLDPWERDERDRELAEKFGI